MTVDTRFFASSSTAVVRLRSSLCLVDRLLPGHLAHRHHSASRAPTRWRLAMTTTASAKQLSLPHVVRDKSVEKMCNASMS